MQTSVGTPQAMQCRGRVTKLLVAGCLLVGAGFLIKLDATGFIGGNVLSRVSRVTKPVMLGSGQIPGQFGQGMRQFRKDGLVAGKFGQNSPQYGRGREAAGEAKGLWKAQKEDAWGSPGNQQFGQNRQGNQQYGRGPGQFGQGMGQFRQGPGAPGHFGQNGAPGPLQKNQQYGQGNQYGQGHQQFGQNRQGTQLDGRIPGQFQTSSQQRQGPGVSWGQNKR